MRVRVCDYGSMGESVSGVGCVGMSIGVARVGVGPWARGRWQGGLGFINKVRGGAPRRKILAPKVLYSVNQDPRNLQKKGE